MRWLAFGIALTLGFSGAQAAEFDREERPAGASADELESPLERGVAPPDRRLGTLFRGTLARLGDLPPIFRDAQIDAQLRTYYFDHETGSGEERKAWAAGGSIGLTTGRLFDRVSLGARWFTSQRLAGGEHKDGNRLLRPRNKGISVLGHAYARVELTDRIFARVGRQELTLPFVNRRDNRMIPNAFEAYWVAGQLPKFAFAVGWVDKIKERDTRDFESMSELAGGTKDRGLALAGFRFRPREDFDIGVINYWNPDTLNVVYAETNWSRTLGREFGLRFSGQFAHQKTLGDNLTTGEEFSTHALGARLATSFRNATVSVAMTSVDRDAAMRSPWGSYPGFLSSMNRDFNRADETAWGVGLSYDFARLGYSGLSLSTQFANGTGAQDDAGTLPNVAEWDITLDFRPPGKRWKGLWARLRFAVVDEAGDGRDDTQARLIFYYDIPKS